MTLPTRPAAPPHATSLAHQAMETSLQLGDRALIAASLAALALVDSWLGRVAEARREAEEATAGFRAAGWIAFQ